MGHTSLSKLPQFTCIENRSVLQFFPSLSLTCFLRMEDEDDVSEVLENPVMRGPGKMTYTMVDKKRSEYLHTLLHL